MPCRTLHDRSTFDRSVRAVSTDSPDAWLSEGERGNSPSASLAVVSGLEITDTTIGSLTGEATLAGYQLEIDGQPCPITQVTPQGIVFLVPETARLSYFGHASPLYIQGPETSRFTDVVVERFWPILDKQQPSARDPDPHC